MTGLAAPGSGDDALMITPPASPAPAAGARPGPPAAEAGPGTPAGGVPGGPADASPAGTSGEQDRAAQREAWGRLRASYARGRRGGPARYWRKAARGQLPSRAGMIRRMPPDGGDAA